MARTERQAEASRVTRAPAGLWQRVVMGVAGFMFLVEAGLAIWLATISEVNPHNGPRNLPLSSSVLAGILILSGSGLGFAAARPPYGISRRIFVGAAILAPFLGIAAFPALILLSYLLFG